MNKDKHFLKLFFTISFIVLGVFLLIIGSVAGFNLFLDWEKLELRDELIIYGIVIGVSFLIGFGFTMLEMKLKIKNNEDKEEKLEHVLAQSDEVLEKLEENIWEEYK